MIYAQCSCPVSSPFDTMSIPILHGNSNASAFEDAFLEWAPQNRRLVMGPLLVGMPIDSILLGIVLAQAAYWRLKLEPYERWRMKLFVASPTLITRLTVTVLSLSGINCPHRFVRSGRERLHPEMRELWG